MENQLISFETAKLAKEKGFSEEVKNYFKIGMMSKGLVQEDCFATDINFKFKDRPMWARPTQSLLQRWLREKHRIDIDISCDYERVNWYSGYRKKGLSYNHLPITYSSYEEALEKSLQEALKLIK